jgi:glycosyltransferase involved in cell wall biosynthesis
MDIDVTVLSPNSGDLQSEWEDTGIDVQILSDLLDNVLTLLTQIRPGDVLIANTILSYRMIHMAHALGVPSIWWIHESSFGLDFINRRPIAAQSFSLADAVVFPCEATKYKYERENLAGSFHVVKNSVVVRKRYADCYNVPELAQHSDDNSLKVINVGSLEPRKGQDILIEAIRLMPEPQVSQLEFYLIGRALDSGFERRIDRTIKRLKNVHRIGELSRDKVLAFLEIADIFVLSSRDEVMPLTLLEALALGKPIVATNVGGIPEVIRDGYNGLLVPPNDGEALACALNRLSSDGDLRALLSRNALREYQTELSFQDFTSNFYNILSSVSDLDNLH